MASSAVPKTNQLGLAALGHASTTCCPVEPAPTTDRNPPRGFHFRTRVLQSVCPSQFALLHAASQDDETRSDSVAVSGKPQVVQPADKARAIETVVAHIEKQFGKGAIMRLGEASRRMAVEAIPTGSIGLDIALGVGGAPRGRVVEIFGPEASGKTTLVQHIIAEAQRTGGVCAIIDAEHALDPEYARKLGVDVDNLFISQPDSGEQALEIAETLVRSAAYDEVAIDSVAALVPRAELEGDMGDSHMGLQARLISQALRKLTGAISRSRTCLIFTNQLREKIGVMFGNPETTTGGRALKFYASVRLDIRRIDSIKDGDAVVGGRVRVKVVKNKVAPPFREAEFDVMYGEWISRTGDLLDLGVDKRIVEKSGAWFAFAGERLGQGRENAKQFLKENPSVRRTIEDRVRRELGLVREADVVTV